MFTVSSVGWHYWSIYRQTLSQYVGNVSALYRPCIGQVSTNTWLIYPIGQPTISQVSFEWVLVECLLSVCSESVDTSANICVGVDCRLGNSQHIDWYSIDIWLILNCFSTECQPVYQPCIRRVSADTLPTYLPSVGRYIGLVHRVSQHYLQQTWSIVISFKLSKKVCCLFMLDIPHLQPLTNLLSAPPLLFVVF